MNKYDWRLKHFRKKNTISEQERNLNLQVAYFYLTFVEHLLYYKH